MKAPIGFKTAEPAQTDGIVDLFYKPLIAAGIAPVVMAIDSAGHCYDVWKLVAGTPLEAQAVMNFRRTGDAAAGQPNGMDVADYDADPVADANRMYDWHMARWPQELPAHRVWTQFTNEPRKEAHEWLARHALQLCRRALADGRRICLFGWAAGTPEPEAWHTAAATELLALLRLHPDQLAIAVNEYSYETDTLNAPHLIGRWQAIPKPWPTVFITEHGWAYNAAPAAGTGIPQLLEAYRKWYAFPNVKGLALWTLDKGRGGRDLPRIINGYMQPLAQAIIATDFPTPSDTTPAPTPPPTVPPTTPDPMLNLLVNGSFDQGWSDDDLNPATQQNPKGWLLRWNLTDTSPYSGQPYLLGEGVHKNAFPPDEQDDFLWDGPWTYKVFAADRPFWARLKQLLDLPAGRYVLKTPVWCDCYRWDKTNKRKDYAIEPHHAQIMVKVTDRVVADWRNLTPGRRNDVETVIDHPGGVFDLAVHFRCHWGIGNNLFVNGWSLAAVAVPAPEPPPVPPTPPTPPAPPLPATVKIADISKWQGRIDPEKMKAAGITAVIARAGYGTTKDQNVDLYLRQLSDAGIPIPAVYHYYEPGKPWRAQLDTLLSVMRPHNIRRAVIDLEDMNFPTAATTRTLEATACGDDTLPPGERRAQNVRQLIDLGIATDAVGNTRILPVQTATVQPTLLEDVRQFLEALDGEMPLADRKRHIIYTNWSYWSNILGRPAWGIQYDLWLAAWTTAARPTVPAPWSTWTLWQHTSSADGPAHGVQSDRIDLNRFNGTVTQFNEWSAATTVPRPDTIDAALRQAAAALQSYIEHPEFALAAAIIKANRQVDSPEARTAGGETTYVLQRALDPATGARHIYYCKQNDWGNVKSIPVAPATTAPTPANPTIDLLPYLKGDGRIYQMEINLPDGQHSQQMQTVERDGCFLQLKNAQWEELWADDAYLYRGTDTSYSQDTYYTLRDDVLTYGSRWCPRYWRPGELYERNPMVTFYWKSDCIPRTGLSAGRQRTWLRFAAVHESYLIGGQLLRDVIELHWLATPTSTTPLETYLYARNYGLVGWTAANKSHSRIVEQFEPGERPPMVPETLPCLRR